MHPVYPGDTLSAEVFAKYEYFEGPRQPLIAGLVTYLASAFGLPPTGEGAFLSNNSSSITAMIRAGVYQAPDEVPQAGLGYLLFDRDLQLVDQGWAAVTTEARIPQDEGALNSHPFERLSLDNMRWTQ